MDPLEELLNKHTAIKRWEAGECPSFSKNIYEELTCGYGELDRYGDWEFPLEPAEHYFKLFQNIT